MKICTITFNPNTDNTRVKFAKEYEDYHWVTKLDALSDAIYDLTQTYNALLAPGPENERKILRSLKGIYND